MNIKKTATDRLPTWPFVRPLAVAFAAIALAGGIATSSDATVLKVQPASSDMVGHVAPKMATSHGVVEKRRGGSIDQPGTTATDRMKDWPYGPGCLHSKKGEPESPLQLRGDHDPKVYP